MPLQLKSIQKKKSKLLTGFNSQRLTTAIAALALTTLLVGCAAPPAQVGLSDLSARPGEKALLAGIRAYEEAQYSEAEKSLTEGLAAGFTVKKDASLAHKYLAFIYCTSERTEDCKKSFLAARAADPSFNLTKKEVGHPQWGPVYKQVIGE
jgi:Tfp pilus assembly protein PilF